MTIISVVLGRTFHYVDEILPFRFEKWNKKIPAQNLCFRFKFDAESECQWLETTQVWWDGFAYRWYCSSLSPGKSLFIHLSK